MATKKVKQPTMLEVAHEMAKDLYEINVIDATTMREFDVLCLTPPKEAPLQKTKKTK
jgi:putative transcriptional regulator